MAIQADLARWMAIHLPARQNRVRPDAMARPDMAALARDHALGLADPPRIDIPSAPGCEVGEGQAFDGTLSEELTAPGAVR
jgi:hypothetical protein